jgi:hypothetical protein
MKKKFGRSFILIPIGLFVLAGTLLLSTLTALADPVKGMLFGVATSLLLLPFIKLQLHMKK